MLVRGEGEGEEEWGVKVRGMEEVRLCMFPFYSLW